MKRALTEPCAHPLKGPKRLRSPQVPSRVLNDKGEHMYRPAHLSAEGLLGLEEGGVWASRGDLARRELTRRVSEPCGDQQGEESEPERALI